MATATAALRTPEDLANRYDRLAKSTGRTMADMSGMRAPRNWA